LPHGNTKLTEATRQHLPRGFFVGKESLASRQRERPEIFHEVALMSRRIRHEKHEETQKS